MNLKKIIILALVVFVLFISIPDKTFSKKQNSFTLASINKKKVYLEVADNDYKRTKGLMNHSELNYQQGMLFIFDDINQVYFWMKNVNYPLDMVFLKNNQIVNIYSGVPTCKNQVCPLYPSVYPVNKVIELKSGFCKKYNVKIGQKVVFAQKNNAK